MFGVVLNFAEKNFPSKKFQRPAGNDEISLSSRHIQQTSTGWFANQLSISLFDHVASDWRQFQAFCNCRSIKMSFSTINFNEQRVNGWFWWRWLEVASNVKRCSKVVMRWNGQNKILFFSFKFYQKHVPIISKVSRNSKKLLHLRLFTLTESRSGMTQIASHANEHHLYQRNKNWI